MSLENEAQVSQTQQQLNDNKNVMSLSISEPQQNYPKTARCPRNFHKNNEVRTIKDAEIAQAKRRGFEISHEKVSRRANLLFQKVANEEERLRSFNFKRELAKRKKSPPRKIVDNHILEKVVSRRRMQLEETEKGGEKLPALLPPFSPRPHLPPEPQIGYTSTTHVFYWA